MKILRPAAALAALAALTLQPIAALAVPPGTVPPFPAPYVQSSLTSGNVLSGLVTNPITAGLIAEYPMNEGSGTVVHDISGNGNTANFNGSKPPAGWTTWGVQFNGGTNLSFGSNNSTLQTINTPIKTFGTVFVHACLATLTQNTGTVVGDSYPKFVSLLGPDTYVASSGNGGIVLQNIASASTQRQPTFMPSTWNAQTITTITTTNAPQTAPCGVTALAVGATDHIYFNGVELPYGAQSSSTSKVTINTGNGYEFGWPGSTTGGVYLDNTWQGTINYATFYTGQLSAAQVAQETAFINYQVNNRPGFPSGGPANASSTPQIICQGDSETAAYPGGTWCNSTYMVLNNTYSFNNWGISGEHAATLAATASFRSLTSVAPASGRNFCLVWEGTNDFAQAVTGATGAAQIAASLRALAAKDTAEGCTPLVATMMSRTGNDIGGSVSLDTDKNTLNALIRANWAAWGYAGLADIAAFPNLGADGAYSNSICFYSDHAHLLSPSGAGTCFGAMRGGAVPGYAWANLINGLDGSTEDNPTVTTNTSYTEAFKDIWLLDTPGSAGAVTLPDCTGLTGQKRWITNASGANAITLATTNSQAFVGSTTVAVNTTAKVVCQLVSASAGGDQWVRTL